MGNNIITLGDGNVINSSFSDLHNALDELKEAITKSQDLNEAQKLDLAVDVESIKDQLAKIKPNKSIISQLWSGLEKIAILSGIDQAFHRVLPLIQSLLS